MQDYDHHDIISQIMLNLNLPLSETSITQFTDAYLRHQASVYIQGPALQALKSF